MRLTKKSTLTVAWLLLLTLTVSKTRADEPEPLPGTKPLTLQGDIASTLVEGVDRFLLRKTDESIARRAAFWKRDVSSPEKYAASVESNRARLKHIIGARDTLVPHPRLEILSRPGFPYDGMPLGEEINIMYVRWHAFNDVDGEGLLLKCAKLKCMDANRHSLVVIVVPDADQTPEQVAGLAPGIAPESQFARLLAQSGCDVLIPTLIDRKVEARNGRARLTSREFLYRPAFELGRHVIGYEVQKVLAAINMVYESPLFTVPNIGVFGYGEGGLIALHAAALDRRIEAVGVSGYFGDRLALWKEPLDRNVFGFLEQFGDAEIASLIAPRPLIVEAAKGPEVVIPPGTGGGPGRLTTPKLEESRAEVERARALTKGLNPAPRIELVVSNDGSGPFGSPNALGAFLDALQSGAVLSPDLKTPAVPRVEAVVADPVSRLLKSPGIDPAERQKRLVHEIDRHNQALLAASTYVRKDYFSRLDTKSLDTFNKTIEPYRTTFRDDVIGKFDDPFLPANARSRKVYDEPKFQGYEVVLDVFPDVIAYGILLVPKGIKPGEKRPVVVCQHGLEGRPQQIADPKVDHPAYHRFADVLAEQGFVTFSPQNLYIFGDRFRTLQRKANPLKKTLFSIIVPQHQQITDWLKTLPFVDGDRIGFYGLSYGGKSAMRIPPLVSNYCLSICSADFNEWVDKNASTIAPYSYVWSNEYEIFEWDLGSTFNYAEMAALIAPRPFMVERGHFDTVGTDETVGAEFAKVRFLYEAKLGIGDRCQIEWFTGPHTIHGVGTFEFLHRHLKWPMAQGK